ncbi:MAG: D-alanyl-D-alanine carboxypeptidase [Clostridiales bacterium]|nr:D-alanyl-D-alanine carboxypeptidase [Clostridiales bacterium]
MKNFPRVFILNLNFSRKNHRERRGRTLVAAWLLLTLVFLSPQRAAHAASLLLDAQACVLVEQESGKTLYAINENERMYPASMTKILTALVALEYLKPNDLVVTGDEVFAIPADASRANHKKGETLVVENLIRGLIIPSGSETACVIAVAVAKKLNNVEEMGYVEAEAFFVRLMNEKAETLGARDSHFVNPHGYHSEDHYSTARDIALIARAGMENELIKRIALEREFSGDGANNRAGSDALTQHYEWRTLNELISGGAYSYRYATGIKTGWMDEAGYCVAASAEKDGMRLIAIVMNSTEVGRWRDAADLFEYGFDNFSRYELQTEGETVLDAPIANARLGTPKRLALVAEKSFIEFLSKDEYETLEQVVTLDEGLSALNGEEREMRAPIVKDQVIGSVAYMIGERQLFEGALLAGADVQERTLITDLEFYFSEFKAGIISTKALYAVGGAIFGVLATLFVSGLRNRRRRRRRYY